MNLLNLLIVALKLSMIHGGLTPRERKATNETYSEFRFQYVIASEI